MIYDEKTRKEHKAAVRRLIARSCDALEIQKEMHSVYGVDFDFEYIEKLTREVRRDQQQEGEKLIAVLATPEGRAEHLKKHQEKMALLDGILGKLTKG